jgi:hypothetical protein
MLQDPVNDALRQMAEQIRAMASRFGYFEGMQFSASDAAVLSLYPSVQSVPNNVWTEVDFNFAFGGTWSLGLGIEDGHAGGDGIDKIMSASIPAECLLLFVMAPHFANNSSGLRGVKWISSDGTYLPEMHPAVSGDETAFTMVHQRRQVIGSVYWHCQVYQNSGAPLNLNFFDFGAFRFR